MLPDEKSQGLGIIQRESRKKITCFRQFWVKEPIHSETVSDEKCHLYRSTRRSDVTGFLGGVEGG